MAESSNSFKLGFAVRSLRHRNYRLFFGGQTLSLVGTWMTQVASSWLVYRLTSSALLLGLVSFSGQLPALLLTPFAGVWVDRWDRRTVLKVTQVLAMLESFALAVLVFSGHANIWYILGLTMFQGVVNAFDPWARDRGEYYSLDWKPRAGAEGDEAFGSGQVPSLLAEPPR